MLQLTMAAVQHVERHIARWYEITPYMPLEFRKQVAIAVIAA
jgi:hypothetical protein